MDLYSYFCDHPDCPSPASSFSIIASHRSLHCDAHVLPTIPTYPLPAYTFILNPEDEDEYASRKKQASLGKATLIKLSDYAKQLQTSAEHSIEAAKSRLIRTLEIAFEAEKRRLRQHFLLVFAQLASFEREIDAFIVKKSNRISPTFDAFLRKELTEYDFVRLEIHDDDLEATQLVSDSITKELWLLGEAQESLPQLLIYANAAVRSEKFLELQKGYAKYQTAVAIDKTVSNANLDVNFSEELARKADARKQEIALLLSSDSQSVQRFTQESLSDIVKLKANTFEIDKIGKKLSALDSRSEQIANFLVDAGDAANTGRKEGLISAEAMYVKAVDMLAQHYPESALRWHTVVKLTKLYIDFGLAEKAEMWVDRLQERAISANQPEVYALIGAWHYQLKRYSQSQQFFAKLHQAGSPLYMNNSAAVLLCLQDCNSARGLLYQALDICNFRSDAATATIYHNLGVLCAMQHRFTESLSMLNESVRIRLAADPQQRHIVLSQHLTGVVAALNGQYQLAIDYFESAERLNDVLEAEPWEEIASDVAFVREHSEGFFQPITYRAADCFPRNVIELWQEQCSVARKRPAPSSASQASMLSEFWARFLIVETPPLPRSYGVAKMLEDHGNALLHQYKLSKAEKWLETTLLLRNSDSEESAKLHLELGKISKQLRNDSDAERHFETGVRIGKSIAAKSLLTAELLSERGDIKYESKRFSDALSDYTESRDIYRSIPRKSATANKLDFTLGLLQMKLENWTEAESLLTKLSDFSQISERQVGIAYRELAIIALNQTRYSDSNTFYANAINQFSNYSKDMEATHLQMAGVFEKKFRYFDAIASYNSAVEILKKTDENSQKLGETMLCLGKIYRRINQGNEAERCLISGIERLSGDSFASACVCLGNLYLYQNKVRNAAETFEKALKTAKDTVKIEIQQCLASVRIRENRIDAAESILKSAILQCRNDPELTIQCFLRLADTLKLKENDDDVLKYCYIAAIECSKSAAFYWRITEVMMIIASVKAEEYDLSPMRRADVFLTCGTVTAEHFREAFSQYCITLKITDEGVTTANFALQQQRSRLLLDLGQLYCRAEQFHEAQRVLRFALQSTSDELTLTDIRFRMCFLCIELLEFENAAHWLDEVLEPAKQCYPNTAEHVQHLISLSESSWFNHEHVESILHLALHAIEELHLCGTAKRDALLRLATVYETGQRRPEVETVYNDVLSIASDTPERTEALLRLSKVKSRQGRFEEASSDLQQIITTEDATEKDKSLALYKQGVIAIKQGQFHLAERLLKAALQMELREQSAVRTKAILALEKVYDAQRRNDEKSTVLRFASEMCEANSQQQILVCFSILRLPATTENALLLMRCLSIIEQRIHACPKLQADVYSACMSLVDQLKAMNQFDTATSVYLVASNFHPACLKSKIEDLQHIADSAVPTAWKFLCWNRILQQNPGSRDKVYADIQIRLGLLELQTNQPELALNNIQSGLATLRTYFADDLSTLSHHYRAGLLLFDNGHNEAAKCCFEELIKLPQTSQKLQRTHAILKLGQIDKRMERIVEAEGKISMSISEFTQFFPISLEIAEAYRSLGLVRESQGRLSDAESNYISAISLLSQHFPSSEQVVGCYQCLAALYERIGRLKEACELYNAALNHCIDRGWQDEKTADLYYNLALLYSDLKMPLMAERCYLSELRLREYGLKNDKKAAQTRHNLGQLYQSSGRYAKAEQHFLSALEKWWKRPEQPEALEDTLNGLAKVYRNDRRMLRRGDAL